MRRKKHRLELAERYYLAALDDEEENPEAMHGLGVVNMTRAQNTAKTGGEKKEIDARLEQAAAYFNATLRLNPFHTQSRWGLATVLAHQGQRFEEEREPGRAFTRYRSALREFDTLISQDPAFESRLDVREKRAGLKAALKRLGG